MEQKLKHHKPDKHQRSNRKPPKYDFKNHTFNSPLYGSLPAMNILRYGNAAR